MNALSRLLRGATGRDFRTFLLFLLLSLLLWHIEKLRQTYTVVAHLNVTCSDVPGGYTTPTVIEKALSVGIQATGFTLLQIRLGRRPSADVNVAQLRRLALDGQTWALYTPTRLPLTNTTLPEDVKIIDVQTDTVMIPLYTVRHKRLPVVVRDAVTLAPQHLFSGPRRVEPDSIELVATNDIIDTIRAVYTEQQPPAELSDTARVAMRLVLPPIANASVASVAVLYPVEPFTEKRVSVHIEGVHCPRGYRCKLFPPHANVTFTVGLSHFERAVPRVFKVVADLQDVEPGGQRTCVRLDLAEAPEYARNARLTPAFAEYLLVRE